MNKTYKAINNLKKAMSEEDVSYVGVSRFRDRNPDDKEDKFEPKVEEYFCYKCKYYEKLAAYEEPCRSCNNGSHFCRIEEKDDIPEPKPEPETVNHPSHYNREGAMECIDEMIMVFGTEAVKKFCLLNAWKYRYRAADKNGEEDLKKSDWYLRKYKEL